MYMMQGLDETVDAAFFVGYHGRSRVRRPRCRTPTTPRCSPARGSTAARGWGSGINALVADHYGVPIAFVSGDEVTWEETAPFAQGAVNVVTEAVDHPASALNLHPSESCRLIRAGAEEAVRRVAAGEVACRGASRPAVPRPRRADRRHGRRGHLGARRRNAPGRARCGSKEEDLLSVFRSFVAVNYITRQAGGR